MWKRVVCVWIKCLCCIYVCLYDMKIKRFRSLLKSFAAFSTKTYLVNMLKMCWFVISFQNKKKNSDFCAKRDWCFVVVVRMQNDPHCHLSIVWYNSKISDYYLFFVFLFRLCFCLNLGLWDGIENFLITSYIEKIHHKFWENKLKWKRRCWFDFAFHFSFLTFATAIL